MTLKLVCRTKHQEFKSLLDLGRSFNQYQFQLATIVRGCLNGDGYSQSDIQLKLIVLERRLRQQSHTKPI